LIGFDVVIIGGGLSGSSTALNLSKKGYSVLIIENEKSQDSKPCAGGMASSMQRFLPLNIEDCIESKIKNVEFRWKATDNVTADLTGESPFWIVKREKLDQLLLDESLSNGAQIIRSLWIEKIIKKNDKWEITCNDKIKYITKFLVIADGSQSKWASYFNLGPRKPKFANTLSLRLKGLGEIPRDAVRFEFGFIKYGFAWAFPLRESLNIGLGTFINNGLLENQSTNKQVIRSFGFDDFPDNYNGAEDFYYSNLESPYLPANDYFQNINEIRQVKGISEDIYQNLEPYICALPNALNLINLNSISPLKPKILVALSENKITDQDAINIIENRPLEGFQEIRDFFNDDFIKKSFATKFAKEKLTTEPFYFNLKTQIKFDEFTFIMNTGFLKDKETMQIISRKKGNSL